MYRINQAGSLKTNQVAVFVNKLKYQEIKRLNGKKSEYTFRTRDKSLVYDIIVLIKVKIFFLKNWAPFSFLSLETSFTQNLKGFSFIAFDDAYPIESLIAVVIIVWKTLLTLAYF